MPKFPLNVWERYYECWKDGCGSHLCELAENVVLGRGSVPADILFVGEAPGESEDTIGIPFVPNAPAGGLLQDWINKGVRGRCTYAITNALGCFPRDENGRKTFEIEWQDIRQCGNRLIEFVKIVNPYLIVCVGEDSRNAFDPKVRGSHKLHKPHHWKEDWIKDQIRVIHILHPSSILRKNVAIQNNLSLTQIAAIGSAVYGMLQWLSRDEEEKEG